MVSLLKEALDARANGTTVQNRISVRDDFHPVGSISEAGVIRLDPSVANTEAARQTLIHLQRIRDDEYTDSSVTARCIAHHLEQEVKRASALPKKVRKKGRQSPTLLEDQYGGYT